MRLSRHARARNDSSCDSEPCGCQFGSCGKTLGLDVYCRQKKKYHMKLNISDLSADSVRKKVNLFLDEVELTKKNMC